MTGADIQLVVLAVAGLGAFVALLAFVGAARLYEDLGRGYFDASDPGDFREAAALETKRVAARRGRR